MFFLLLRLTNDFSLNEFEDEDLSELTEITDQYHDPVGGCTIKIFVKICIIIIIISFSLSRLWSSHSNHCLHLKVDDMTAPQK